MQKMLLILPLLGIFLSPDDNTVERTFSYNLGNRTIALKRTAYGRNKNIIMINLHSDETTGVAAAVSVLERTGGTLLSIENNYQRYITFSQRGKTYKFDPNRIFSKKGIKATLLEQNKHSTNAAISSIHGFTNFLLNRIPRHAAAVIALHNNDDGGLSVLTYMKGGDFEKDAAAVHKSDMHDPDNFFLTTDRTFFRQLRSAGYNVVLQDNKAEDDGSLSIYYGRKNKRYINIEAETGSVEEQREMIEVVVSLIRER